jgi:hypothetical protein
MTLLPSRKTREASEKGRALCPQREQRPGPKIENQEIGQQFGKEDWITWLSKLSRLDPLM